MSKDDELLSSGARFYQHYYDTNVRKHGPSSTMRKRPIPIAHIEWLTNSFRRINRFGDYATCTFGFKRLRTEEIFQLSCPHCCCAAKFAQSSSTLTARSLIPRKHMEIAFKLF